MQDSVRNERFILVHQLLMNASLHEFQQGPLFANHAESPDKSVLNESWRANFEDFTLNYHLCSFKKPQKVISTLTSDFAGICYNIQGAFTYTGFPEGTIDKNRFNILYIPQGQYECTLEGITFIITIHFRRHFVDKLTQSIPKLAQVLEQPPAEPWQMHKKSLSICAEVMDIFQAAFDFGNNQHPKVRFMYLHAKMGEAIIESMHQLITGYDPGSPVLQRHLENVVAAHDHIVNNLGESLSLHELAHVAGTTKANLEKGFQDLYGATVQTFITNQRMEKAVTLLLKTEMHVPDIVKVIGYKSVPNFIQSFKRRYGLTPAAYRKVMREKDH